MKYFIDTEFYERPSWDVMRGAHHVELISIGIVAEDGREYYGENHDFNWAFIEALAHHPYSTVAHTPKWLLENVRPHLTGPEIERWPIDLRADIEEFIGADQRPEFWGYYADYDWVAFCSLFGRMVDLPRKFPMFCLDLKQVMVLNGISRGSLPAHEGDEHNALADARWHKQVYDYLVSEGCIK